MKKIALIRGKFLTKYDMEPFELLSRKYDLTAFSSSNPMSENLNLTLCKLWSPVDLPEFSYKMQILNRLFIDAHYLYGLEEKLKGFEIAHSAETYFGYTQQVLNAKKRGYVKKVVVSVLENIPFNNEGIRGRKAFKKRTIEEADHFIALSKGAKKALIAEGADDKRISEIGFGINTTKFYPSKKKNKYLNILFVGRIEHYKGIFDAIEVFREIASSYPNAKLTIVGKGTQESKLKTLIKMSNLENKVELKSVSHESIAEEYRKADIFIAPSKRDRYWMEQFGMVFLEAMASGIPIIATKSGAIPEVVGKDAFLVEEGDVAQMKKYLSILSSSVDLRRKMGSLLRQRAIKFFDINIIAKKLDNVYENL